MVLVVPPARTVEPVGPWQNSIHWHVLGQHPCSYHRAVGISCRLCDSRLWNQIVLIFERDLLTDRSSWSGMMTSLADYHLGLSAVAGLTVVVVVGFSEEGYYGVYQFGGNHNIDADAKLLLILVRMLGQKREQARTNILKLAVMTWQWNHIDDSCSCKTNTGSRTGFIFLELVILLAKEDGIQEVLR